MDISKIASLDFETTSKADLRKTGSAKYARDPSTRIMCASFYIPDWGYGRWSFRDFVPEVLMDWVADGKPLSGWNVGGFEYWIWNHAMKKQWTGVPDLKREQLVDTMAVAAYNGLPLSLDQAAQALPQLNIRKDKEGHALMMRMSRPRSLTAGTWWHEDDPEKLARLMDYCDQDVKVERAILGALHVMPARERSLWIMDHEIMSRGMRLDQTLAGKMRKLADGEIARLDWAMNVTTSGAVPKTTSATALVRYAQGFNPNITSLAKDKIAGLLADPNLHMGLRVPLEIRQEAAKSSIAKLDAMKNYADVFDGRMRGLTQYYGAFRTGRWAGRGPQLQNYPRSVVKDQLGLVYYILMGGDADGFELFFGVNALEGLSSALRGCVAAARGKKFGSIDFSQIEARVLPWLAGDTKGLMVFFEGKDVYIVAAAGIYRIGEGSVDGDQRQVGKVSVLALGYGGGVGAFQTMAKNYGLVIPDQQAEEIKTAWREANPVITDLWWALDKAATKAVKSPGTVTYAGPHISFRMVGDNLLMKLPSGRLLFYRDAEIGVGKFDNECVTYMGINQYTRAWEREDTYGGKLAENATQAVARDVMADAMLRARGIPTLDILGSVHDELLFEFELDSSYDALHRIMNQAPGWARGLPVAAEGYVGERFKKG